MLSSSSRLQKHTVSSEPTYKQRSPTQTNIFQVVQKHWKSFVRQADYHDKTISMYAKREFEAYLGCGVLSKGFVRMVCDSCNQNRFIPFSCKKRGFCPSCCGRRMNEGAAFLVDHVIPHVPIRQWVVSFPIPMRFWMAKNPKLMNEALRTFQKVLQAHYRKNARQQGAKGKLQAGAITVIQRFGGALNLNIHFHILVLDGVYETENGFEPFFFQTLKPSNKDIQNVIKKYQIKMLKVLQRRGLVPKDEFDNRVEEFEEPEDIQTLSQGASVLGRIGTGEGAGQKVRKIRDFGTRAQQAFFRL